MILVFDLWVWPFDLSLGLCPLPLTVVLTLGLDLIFGLDPWVCILSFSLGLILGLDSWVRFLGNIIEALKRHASFPNDKVPELTDLYNYMETIRKK